MIWISKRRLQVVAALVAGLTAASPSAAGVVQRNTGLWPGGQVRYGFGPGVTAADQAAVRLAMQSWTAAGAPVRFVTATSGPRLIILRHQSDDGANRCRATVGRAHKHGRLLLLTLAEHGHDEAARYGHRHRGFRDADLRAWLDACVPPDARR